MQTIGERLKHFRIEAGLSASSVARKLGVAPSTYREWENGRAIRGETYLKLAAIFKVSLYELFGSNSPKSLLATDIKEIEKVLDRMRGYS
jgi:transcriptional regulator with XRE-family HTH domain